MASSLTELVGADIMKYPSELPKFEVDTSLEFTIAQSIASVRSSISNLISHDIRPYLLTKLLINTIPDPQWRLETTKHFNELCKKYSIDDISSREIIIACTDVVGRVTDWCAQFKGGSIMNVGIGML